MSLVIVRMLKESAAVYKEMMDEKASQMITELCLSK